MDPVTGIAAVKGIQAVSNVVSKVLQSDGDSGFDAVLKSLLQPNAENSVNEEELFAALLKERITAVKGEDAAKSYEELLTAKKEDLRRADGYVPVEQAAQAALRDLVSAGTLTEEEASKMRAEAFEAAQLDDNNEKLFDGMGSSDDPTIAVMGLEEALERARLQIDAFNSGEKTADIEVNGLSEETSENIEPNGSEIDGSGSGFLWKPESDHGGNAVVLMPPDLAQQVESAVLVDAAGSEIEAGVSSGYGNPDAAGEREHFRFSEPGSAYADDLYVKVTLTDGSVRMYHIPNPGERYD